MRRALPVAAILGLPAAYAADGPGSRIRATSGTSGEATFGGSAALALLFEALLDAVRVWWSGGSPNCHRST
jgi:hypothetical protein